MSLLSRTLTGVFPGAVPHPLGGAIGAVGGLLKGMNAQRSVPLAHVDVARLLAEQYRGQIEPEIPSALDDWDRDFELATGSLPEFSPLRRRA